MAKAWQRIVQFYTLTRRVSSDQKNRGADVEMIGGEIRGRMRRGNQFSVASSHKGARNSKSKWDKFRLLRSGNK